MEEQNLSLVGFRDLDSATVDIIKKNAINYARKFTRHESNIELLKITLKINHEREKGEIYEIHSHLQSTGKDYHAKSEDRNLLSAVDDSLRKIEKEIS